MKLRINPDALARLTPGERREVEAQLRELEDLRRANPLVFYRPHPKQVTLHASTDPLKLFLGGNRAGKTTCGINDDLIQALPASALPEHLLPYKRWQPPFYCRIVVPDLGATLEGVTLQKIREWCPPSELAGGTFSDAWDSKLRVLRFRSGSWFQFLSNDQDLDKFGGAALHRVHYDEEPREDIRRECLMRLIDYDGDELFTMTPQWGMSWVFGEIFEPWEAGALTECTVVVVDIDDNPHLGARGKERAMAGLSSEERQARKAGRFVHFAGLIYPEFSRERHVIPAISELPPGVTVLSGIDPGIGRQAAVVFAYVDFDDALIVFDEIAVQGANVEQICAEYHRRCEYWKIRPRFNVIDPSARNRDMVTGKALREEYTKHGVVTILGQNSQELGFNIGKERFERTPPGILITADCPALVGQLGRYRWRSDPRSPEGTPASRPIKQDDHLCDALRYLWCSPMVTPRRPPVEDSATAKDRLLREHLKRLERPTVQHPAGPGVYA